MKKTFIILPVISILYFSCTKDTATHPPLSFPIDTLTDGWKEIPLDHSFGLGDIFFINQTGFAIGGQTILKSSDGGNTWSQLTLPSGVNPPELGINIGMGNEMNAIFAGYGHGQLVSTRDGGVSFTVSNLPDDNLVDVFFVDSTTAYAAGKNIWKTTDAGNNWVKLYSSPGYNSNYSSLYFLNAQIGWVQNYGLRKTVNGGVDWQLVPIQLNTAQAIFFLNPDTGYISNGQYVVRTMDGGLSWTTIFTGSGAGYMDIHFVSDKTGYVTDNKCIYKTQDGGNTWTKEVTLAYNPLYELHFTDPDHGWACGENGTILKYSR